jgi:hypothetical protein
MSTRLRRLLGHGVLAAATALAPHASLGKAPSSKADKKSKPKKEAKKKPEKFPYQKPVWPDVAGKSADRPSLLTWCRSQYDALRKKMPSGPNLLLRISLRDKLNNPRWVTLMERASLTTRELEELDALDTISNLEALGKARLTPVGTDKTKLEAARATMTKLYPRPPPPKPPEKPSEKNEEKKQPAVEGGKQ